LHLVGDLFESYAYISCIQRIHGLGSVHALHFMAASEV